MRTYFILFQPGVSQGSFIVGQGSNFERRISALLLWATGDDMQIIRDFVGGGGCARLGSCYLDWSCPCMDNSESDEFLFDAFFSFEAQIFPFSRGTSHASSTARRAPSHDQWSRRSLLRAGRGRHP